MWTSHTVTAQQTPVDIVKVPSPQLHELGKVGESLQGLLLWNAQVISVAKFFSADWDSLMAKETAQIAYQEANWMTVAEVKYFIARLKAGKYPHNKNLSPAVFMEFLNEYINEVLANRGAVNSYAWRNKAAEERELPLNPATGEPGQPMDPDVMKTVMKDLELMVREADRIHKENDERIRKAKWQGLKNQRDQKIIDLVEADAAQGIAPDKFMMWEYFEALERVAAK